MRERATRLNSTNKRTIQCPSCGTSLNKLTVVRYDSPFRCTNCGIELQVPRRYLLIGGWLSVAITFILCLGMGLRNVTFLLGMLILFFPAMFTIGILQRRLFPPRLVIFRDPTSILR